MIARYILASRARLRGTWTALAGGLALALLALVLVPTGQVAAQTEGLPMSMQSTASLTSAGAAYARFDQVPVHTAAGREHGSISHLSLYEQVEVLARNTVSDWLYILYREDSLGWVAVADVLTGVNVPLLPVVDDLTAPVGENLPRETLAQAGLSVSLMPAGPLAARGKAWVTAPALHVRSGPNTSYRSLGVVYKGAELTIFGRSAAPSIWLRVQTPDGQLDGWVAGGEVESSVAYLTLPILSAPPTDAYGIAVVTAGALNVRAGPDFAYFPLGVVYQRDVLTALGRSSSGAWLKVRAENGMEGWVASGEVAVDVPFSRLPVLSADEDVFG